MSYVREYLEYEKLAILVFRKRFEKFYRRPQEIVKFSTVFCKFDEEKKLDLTQLKSKRSSLI